MFVWVITRCLKCVHSIPQMRWQGTKTKCTNTLKVSYQVVFTKSEETTGTYKISLHRFAHSFFPFKFTEKKTTKSQWFIPNLTHNWKGKTFWKIHSYWIFPHNLQILWGPPFSKTHKIFSLQMGFEINPYNTSLRLFRVSLTLWWDNHRTYQQNTRKNRSFLEEWVPKNSKLTGIKTCNSNRNKHKRRGSFSQNHNSLLSISVWSSTKFVQNSGRWGSGSGNSLPQRGKPGQPFSLLYAFFCVTINPIRQKKNTFSNKKGW